MTKTIILAATLAASFNAAAAETVCDQMRSYGQAAYNAYESGATKSELFTRVQAQAPGSESAQTLMTNAINVALRAKDYGDAGRKTYAWCKSLGL